MKIERLMEQIETDQGFERFLKIILIGSVIIIILLFNNVFATTTEESISATSTENGTTTGKKGFEEESFGTEEESFEMGILSNGCDTIFEDDFNSYNDGNLHGQGDWSGDTNYQVQGTQVLEGAKAISYTNQSGQKEILKIGSNTTDGKIVAYIRRTSTSDGDFYFRLKENSTLVAIMYLGSNGKLGHYSTQSAVDLIDYTVDTWYLLQIEWRNSDKKLRFQVDSEGWTDWVNPFLAWTNHLNTVDIAINAMTASSLYIDYIACEPYVEPEPPADYVSLTNLTILYFVAFMIMIMAITLFTKRKNVT